MNQLVTQLAPEIGLATVACVLFLLGTVRRAEARRLAPVIALFALAGAFAYELNVVGGFLPCYNGADGVQTYLFGHYIKMISAGVGVILLLLAWPTNRDATGNTALNFGQEAAEFYALMLLSICGLFLVAAANDIILLFLAVELASIPTYIMVSISRPAPVAQEAGVKYFFLGALSAAIMLFGFSYLYGATGHTSFDGIRNVLRPAATLAAPNALETPPLLTSWQMLAVLLVLTGLAFKIAAVPMHVYAGDVYQGAATPVTAFLSFVPKTSGFMAIVKLLAVIGGAHWAVPPQIARLLWIVAVLTMTIGNVLGLLQYNIKRLLAYSSIAHSGYILVGLAAMTAPVAGVGMFELPVLRTQALAAVAFYLAAYGIMNAAAFGVLMLFPSRPPAARPIDTVERAGAPGASAETFEDIAGQGRRHVALGLCMAVACFSLIGLPLTVGFFGKFMLIRAAFSMHLFVLAIVAVVNAALSAAYYLKIVATLFLRSDAPAAAEHVASDRRQLRLPIGLAIGASVAGTLLLGVFLPATDLLQTVCFNAAEHAQYNDTHAAPPRRASPAAAQP